MPRILTLLAAVLAAGIWSGASAESTRSAGGLYQLSLSAEAKTPWNAMKSWRLRLTRPGGTPVTGAAITVTGGTVDHVHALPTRPRVRSYAGGGYLVEGVKFDRQGRWRLTFDINAGGARDTATIEIQASVAVWAEFADDWTQDERAVLRSLWIGSLPDLPPDATNAVADNPAAAEFGHRLFFDNRLSANGLVACVTCHIPELAFTDGRKNARGVGLPLRINFDSIAIEVINYGRCDRGINRLLSAVDRFVENYGYNSEMACYLYLHGFAGDDAFIAGHWAAGEQDSAGAGSFFSMTCSGIAESPVAFQKFH
jgi:hypothetical protein